MKKIKNDIQLKGEYKLIVKENGKVIREQIIENTIMRNPCYELADVLSGSIGDLEVKYLAVGDGDTATTNTDTSLDNEVFRTFRGSLTRNGYVVFSEFNILKAEANTTLKEMGIFVGSSASSSVDTGKLWSRVLINPPLLKTSSIELLVQYTVTFIRA